MGNECADHAAALGALGLVSNQCLNVRWPPPRFDTSSLVRNCDDFVDVEQRLRDALGERTPYQQSAPGFSVVVTLSPCALLGFLCLWCVGSSAASSSWAHTESSSYSVIARTLPGMAIVTTCSYTRSSLQQMKPCSWPLVPRPSEQLIQDILTEEDLGRVAF